VADSQPAPPACLEAIAQLDKTSNILATNVKETIDAINRTADANTDANWSALGAKMLILSISVTSTRSSYTDVEPMTVYEYQVEAHAAAKKLGYLYQAISDYSEAASSYSVGHPAAAANYLNANNSLITTTSTISRPR
jgi:hypothetical protein